MPLIDDLTPAQANDEAHLRAQLWDLAELHAPVDRTVAYVSRRPDDGRLHVRLDDGEIVYIASDTVDAYLQKQAPRPDTLKRQRRRFHHDMWARGKTDCAAALVAPPRPDVTAIAPRARPRGAGRPAHRRSARATRAGPDDSDEPPGPAGARKPARWTFACLTAEHRGAEVTP